jgi:hypothetical protein
VELFTGSNVYNVLCPGRFNFLWAALSSEITFEGKLRKNKTISKNIRMAGTTADTIKSITDDMLWPDAWKITITIKDLTPNNFNTYINYFVHGFETSAEILATLKNKTGGQRLSDDMKSLGNAIINADYRAAGAAAKEYVEAKAKEVATEIKNAAADLITPKV